MVIFLSVIFFSYENGSLKENRKMNISDVQQENDDHNCFLTHQRVRKELKKCRKSNVKWLNITFIYVGKYLIWNI